MADMETVMRLIWNALETQQNAPNAYTEANADPEIKALGNAAIANLLELLGKNGIVADVQPTFGTVGIGFAYRISSKLVDKIHGRDELSSYVATAMVGPLDETSKTITELLSKCEGIGLNIIYRDDLLTSLRELRICFIEGCYIACLALSGKLLEICLKQLMLDQAIEFDDSWMIGNLLQALERARSEKYLGQSLPEMARIINKSRIPAVHAKEKIPVPSRHQAIMVIHAVADTMQLVLIKP
ncbi:MAG: hypothetical protein ACRENZ_02325 [Thermodesulfobacteriota bacterium]